MTKEFDEGFDFAYSKLISKEPTKLLFRLKAGGRVQVKIGDSEEWRDATPMLRSEDVHPA